jgi:hypothetical protein
MPTNKAFNIKYGNKDSLSRVITGDGVLYVAIKDNNRAELYVDLDHERLLISDATAFDDDLISVEDIDEICEMDIEDVNLEEVLF